MAKALLIGNLTLDHLNKAVRVGGPGYYGGLALGKYMDTSVYLYTSMNPYYRVLFSELYRYVDVFEHGCSELPEFIISSGGASRALSRGCRLSCRALESILDSVKPDFIVVSPVLGEVDECMVDLVKEYKARRTLDLQGFTRSVNAYGEIVNRWRKGLEDKLSGFDLIHGNIAEYGVLVSERGFSLGTVLGTVHGLSSRVEAGLTVSMGGLGAYVFHRGKAFYIPAVRVDPVDEVGAGDVLLSIASYYLLEKNLLDSTVYGVIAGSLKVGRAFDKWFSREELDVLFEKHRRRVEEVDLKS